MIGKTIDTTHGTIHYWIDPAGACKEPQLVFLPGLTADHRLFDRQIEYFEGRYPVFVWDAPGHAGSYPFEMTFSLEDKAGWLNDILTNEGFDKPVITDNLRSRRIPFNVTIRHNVSADNASEAEKLRAFVKELA